MYYYTYTFSSLIVGTQFHVARMQTKFFPSWPALQESFYKSALESVDVFETVPKKCVHNRPMCIVCPGVLSKVVETS
jgi:hypothetical protein